jgi:hypothetical protein
VRQCAAVAGMVPIGVVAGLAHARWSGAVVGAAGVVLVVLLVVLAGVRQRVRDEAIDLLLTGYQNAPISAVQKERRRLSSGRARLGLSRTYVTIARQAQPGAGLVTPGARPLFQRSVVQGVVEELLAIARALEAGRACAPAVARAERLITNGTSKLYGSDQHALKAELNRILGDLQDQ